MARKAKLETSPAERARKAAFDLTRTSGWRHVTMSDIAEKSKLSLGELLGLYPSKSAIVRAYINDLDNAMLGALPTTNEETPRERLFDILMSRFDALNPDKEAFISILRSDSRDPLMTICHLFRLKRSLSLMLEAAGLSSVGIFGRIRLKGLALVYANTFRAWLADDSADMAKTMAKLDQSLAKAEKIATLCLGKSQPADPLETTP